MRILERQREGIELAKAQGVYQRKLTDEDVQACRAMVDMGISVAEAARRYGVSRQTLYNTLKGAGAYSPAEQPIRLRLFMIEYMSYMPIRFNGSTPHYPDVLNSHKARRRPDRPKIPVLARLIWENDGEQRCQRHALRLDPGMAIFVELRDPRCRSTGVWLSPDDVIWPEKR